MEKMSKMSQLYIDLMEFEASQERLNKREEDYWNTVYSKDRLPAKQATKAVTSTKSTRSKEQ